MVRQVETIGERRLLDALLHARPTGKAVLARDGELRIGELEIGGEDFGVCCFYEAGMKLADDLRDIRSCAQSAP